MEKSASLTGDDPSVRRAVALRTGEADHARTLHRDWHLDLAGCATNGLEGYERMYWWDLAEVRFPRRSLTTLLSRELDSPIEGEG